MQETSGAGSEILEQASGRDTAGWGGRRSVEQARGRDTAGWGGRRTGERSGQRQELIVGDRRVESRTWRAERDVEQAGRGSRVRRVVGDGHGSGYQRSAEVVE